MSLQNAIKKSWFLHLEDIAKNYGIQWYYYNNFLIRNYDTSAQYFIMFHETYREKVETFNVIEEYEAQDSDCCLGWRIFKIDERYPLATISEVRDFARYAELVYNLFDRYDIKIPESEGYGYRDYIVSRYFSVIDTSRDKGMRYLDENAMNNDIKNYYNSAKHEADKERQLKKGFTFKTKYKDRLLEMPVTNKNCLSKEELFDKYGDIESFGIDYYNLLKFEEKIKDYPEIVYHRSLPYVTFDNRTHMIDGKRFDDSSGKDIYAVSGLYYPKKYKDKLIPIYYVALYPCLEKRIDIKLDQSNGLVQIGLSRPYIKKFDKKMSQYGLKYLLDYKVKHSNGYVVSVLIEPMDAPMVNRIIDEMIFESLTHIYNPKLEYELYPETKYEIDKVAEKKALKPKVEKVERPLPRKFSLKNFIEDAPKIDDQDEIVNGYPTGYMHVWMKPNMYDKYEAEAWHVWKCIYCEGAEKIPY